MWGMSRFMVLCFYHECVRAPSAMNIRLGAVATDFSCAIRNRGYIIHAITESMKRNKSARLQLTCCTECTQRDWFTLHRRSNLELNEEFDLSRGRKNRERAFNSLNF